MWTILLTGFLLVSTPPIQHARRDLPPLPDREGFAGAFAGVSRQALLVAGGANFPGKKPWEGGKKLWSDRVFLLDAPDGKWREVGKLPRPLGYGVSVTHGNGVVCVGGSDANRHHAQVFRLLWDGTRLSRIDLPPLPRPLANACGALIDNTLYIAGGQEQPDSPITSRAFYRIDLAAPRPRWELLPTWPGDGRMLAVAAGFKGAFWLIGGVDLVKGTTAASKRRYLRDAYRYDPRHGWKRLADLPFSVAAAPSPAPTSASSFFLLGGDDGSQVGSPPLKHRGFSRQILHYDPAADRWDKVGTLTESRVTVPCVRWHDLWIVPSGEVRPGIRSPRLLLYSGKD